MVKMVEINVFSAQTLRLAVYLRFVIKTSWFLYETEITPVVIIVISFITSFSKSFYKKKKVVLMCKRGRMLVLLHKIETWGNSQKQ